MPRLGMRPLLLIRHIVPISKCLNNLRLPCHSVSSTQSLSSSILETTFANGRRYHRKSEGKYFMPIDEAELNRLDLFHHLCLTLHDGELTTVPVEGRTFHNVLDCGTGTGIWALVGVFSRGLGWKEEVANC